ncbi:MAG TPA: NAD(P)-dependent oxidoreductase [Nitrospira sp.]|nr:NAD(P)-dependent oxidoreductase [Nitrospira sp.]
MEPVTLTSKTHVMISGGAGFIGSYLSRRLLKMGSKVTILTRHIHAPRAVQLSQEGATVIECDLSSPNRVPRGERLLTADMFFHMAADVSVSSPALWAANVEGTQRALALASSLQVPYVVFASSIEAQGLGSDQEIPLCEKSACRPVSDYGASKAQAEKLVAQWVSETGQKALTFRIGNIYGPGSPWMLQPSLMALLGLAPLTQAWAQLQHRVFQPLYIDDLIEGMVSAVNHDLTGLYNITGEEPVTVGGYLHAVASLLQIPERFSTIEASTLPQASVQGIPADFAYMLMGNPECCHRSYANTKLITSIGSYVRWPLARGLASTLRWFQQTGSWPALLHMVQARRGAGLCMSH